MNVLMDRIGIRLPIIQAPMAGISTPAMAAAATNAGALGSIGIGTSTPEQARTMIAELRSRSDGPFNVNVFCHRQAVRDARLESAWIERWRDEFAAVGADPPTQLHEIYRSFVVDEAMLRVLLDERPPIVSFHFGMPHEAAIRALRDAGCLLIGSATSLGEARQLEVAGIEAIVAQGWEAGGHRGMFDPASPDDQLGTLALTQLLVRGTSLPVISAGGIMTGAGIAAALRLGAAAAQLGTAFVAADESLADSGYRDALASDAAYHTAMTSVISGRPARCLSNRFTNLGAGIPTAEIPAYPVAYDLGKALNLAGKRRGRLGFGAQWAGQGAPLARSLPTARIVEELAAELRLPS
jgi:nitronate monooxygenase